jgi:hypothetical protein
MLKCAVFVLKLAIAVLKNVVATIATTVNVVPNPADAVPNLVAKWQQHKQASLATGRCWKIFRRLVAIWNSKCLSKSYFTVYILPANYA